MPLFLIALSGLPGFANLIHHDVKRIQRSGEWNQLILDE